MRTAGNNNKILKQFRLPAKMVSLLSSESKRTRRTMTAIMEVAFAHYMARKAQERDQIKAAL